MGFCNLRPFRSGSDPLAFRHGDLQIVVLHRKVYFKYMDDTKMIPGVNQSGFFPVANAHVNPAMRLGILMARNEIAMHYTNITKTDNF